MSDAEELARAYGEVSDAESAVFEALQQLQQGEDASKNLRLHSALAARRAAQERLGLLSAKVLGCPPGQAH
jgi:hypothetical protein